MNYVIVTKPVVVVKESVKNRILCLSKASFDAVVLKLATADPLKRICALNIGASLYVFDYLADKDRVVLDNFTRIA